MQVLETIADFRRARAAFTTLGFVPTMGFLHEGHLNLVRQAKTACGAVAVSIFVNPTQFGPQEDFSSYPRNTERDLALLEAEGVDLVFIPDVAEMYPSGFTTYVQVEQITEVLEGAARPTHFRGVTTVVCKLLNIVQPSHAYFGQKDAQQTVVVRRMVRDLNMPVEIVVCPTVREPNGLAMSSRNAYLSPEEHQATPIIYRALTAARRFYEKSVRDANILRQTMQLVLETEPLAQIEYISVAHPETLQELDEVGEAGALMSLAVRLGKTRLIDNMLLEGQTR
jgi:pantoate--beta-alanine ligase